MPKIYSAVIPTLGHVNSMPYKPPSPELRQKKTFDYTTTPYSWLVPISRGRGTGCTCCFSGLPLKARGVTWMAAGVAAWRSANWVSGAGDTPAAGSTSLPAASLVLDSAAGASSISTRGAAGVCVLSPPFSELGVGSLLLACAFGARALRSFGGVTESFTTRLRAESSRSSSIMASSSSNSSSSSDSSGTCSSTSSSSSPNSASLSSSESSAVLRREPLLVPAQPLVPWLTAADRRGRPVGPTELSLSTSDKSPCTLPGALLPVAGFSRVGALICRPLEVVTGPVSTGV